MHKKNRTRQGFCFSRILLGGVRLGSVAAPIRDSSPMSAFEGKAEDMERGFRGLTVKCRL